MNRVLMLAAALLLGGCAAFTEHEVGIADGRLKPCGDWPRCVSSADTGEKAVAPIRLREPADLVWPRVRDAVLAIERVRRVDERPGYLRAEIDSPWGWYIDDLELLARGERVLDVRSTGRIGYYDFGVNRERIEALRTRLVESGVALPEPQ